MEKLLSRLLPALAAAGKQDVIGEGVQPPVKDDPTAFLRFGAAGDEAFQPQPGAHGGGAAFSQNVPHGSKVLLVLPVSQ